MATIAPPPPEVERQVEDTGGGLGDSGFAGWGGDGGGEALLPSRRYYTGMLLALAAIVMFFTAFTSAYVIRKGLSGDWQATAMPAILWWNTAVLLASSFTLEKARRCWGDLPRLTGWWVMTTGLGIVFLGGQIVAWRQLAARGVYLDTNPSSSFFYLLTGSHGAHLAGGVVALLYLLFKVWRRRLKPNTRAAVGATALYWHFMDGLWIYLFVLLLFWR